MTSEAAAPKLFGPEMLANPYPVYHKLRAAQPVHWVPALEAWVVTSHELVSAALRNPLLSSDRFDRARQRLAAKGMAVPFDDRMKSMIHRDPPDHTRLRGLVNKAFTPRAVDALEGYIGRVINEALDRVQPAGKMELIHDLAYPLPVIVIAEMLGVPTEDRAKFKKWSDELSVALSGDVASLSEATLKRVLQARGELVDYFRAIVERRRKEPGLDLLTALVQAEEGGGRLNEDEIYSMAVLLLIAGNETTTNLIGNGLNALLHNPEQVRRLWADGSLVATAVEEMLRYDSPVQLTTRLAKQDLEMGGTKIAAGQAMYLLIGAANRDPAVFAEPDRFDVGRADNKHLAFGAGPHFCLGAPLARLEAKLTLEALRRRFPGGLQPGAGEVKYRNNFNLRGLEALPVEF